MILEIIGTLPEWGALMISLGGAALLYSTLKSQIEVQRISQSLFKIELDRQLDLIKPDFDILISKPTDGTWGGEFVITLVTNGKQYFNLSYKFKEKYDFFKELPLTRGSYDRYPTLRFSTVNKPIERLAHLWLKYDDPQGTSYEIRFLISNMVGYVPEKIGPYRQGVIFESNSHLLDGGLLASFEIQADPKNLYKRYDEQLNSPLASLKLF